VFSDAENTQYVYDWRLQQESAMRASKGTGMTDEQVVNFVNGCMLPPSPNRIYADTSQTTQLTSCTPMCWGMASSQRQAGSWGCSWARIEGSRMYMRC